MDIMHFVQYVLCFILRRKMKRKCWTSKNISSLLINACTKKIYYWLLALFLKMTRWHILCNCHKLPFSKCFVSFIAMNKVQKTSNNFFSYFFISVQCRNSQNKYCDTTASHGGSPVGTAIVSLHLFIFLHKEGRGA